MNQIICLHLEIWKRDYSDKTETTIFIRHFHARVFETGVLQVFMVEMPNTDTYKTPVSKTLVQKYLTDTVVTVLFEKSLFQISECKQII